MKKIFHISKFICWNALGWLFLAALLPAQSPQNSTVPALQNIRFHSAHPLPVKPDRLERKYRFTPLRQARINAIRQEILQELHREGYYLARIDSLHVEKIAGGKKGVLHIYLTTGEQFILKAVETRLPDSLSGRFAAELKDVTEPFLNKPYTEAAQKEMFRLILNRFENEGYPLCRILTEGFTLNSVKEGREAISLQLRVNPGPLVRLQGLRLPPKSHINVRYLERSLHFKPGEIYREKKISRYRQILKRQDFIRSAASPQVVLSPDSLFYLQLYFREAPVTALDGVVGYVPPPANDPAAKGYFTGLFNISLRNVFGTGRRMEVFWQKPDRHSEEFRVKYREPFVLGLPFHAGVALHRLVRDTTYIEWKYALDVDVPLSENLSGIVRLYSRQVFPDTLASRTLRLPQTSALHTEMGLRWDTRDDRFNPRRGLFLSALFDYGTQRNVGPAYLLKEDSLAEKIRVTRMTGKLSLFLQLIKKQVLALNLNTVLIGYKGQPVRLPDMFWFGGATSVRGYREQQFYGERVGWINSEYRFLLGAKSRFFVFTDVGYYRREFPQEKEEFLTGYGLGVCFPAPLGIMQVDYGLAKGAPFREGKIHFRLVNEF